METPSSFTPFTLDPIRRAIQAILSAHLHRPWNLRDLRDLADLASHPAAILSDVSHRSRRGGSYPVFVKFSPAPDGLDQFEAELRGLTLLHDRAGALTPIPIGVFPVEGGHLLLMEAVEAVAERTPLHWHQIGQTLARIHQVKGAAFGLDTHGYFGPLPQDNTPAPDWPAFYAGRRLAPGLKLALDSGNLPLEAARKVERLIARLPRLCSPAVTPALIHGDAQQNNFISTAAGAVVIDPAVYYGHPEMDLAFVDYFAPVPMQHVLDGYREVGQVDSGFPERRELWRVWGWLACVTVGGEGYVNKLLGAVEKYL
jgi:protein-ribulosamine 3-kinase